MDTGKIVGGSKLLGEMRDAFHRRHYSIRTEQAYLGWVKRYILFRNQSSLMEWFAPLPKRPQMGHDVGFINTDINNRSEANHEEG